MSCCTRHIIGLNHGHGHSLNHKSLWVILYHPGGIGRRGGSLTRACCYLAWPLARVGVGLCRDVELSVKRGGVRYTGIKRVIRGHVKSCCTQGSVRVSVWVIGGRVGAHWCTQVHRGYTGEWSVHTGVGVRRGTYGLSQAQEALHFRHE